jgi:hypothetical protein
MKHLQNCSFYNAFGLTIASEIELHELRPSAPVQEPDLLLRRGTVRKSRAVRDDHTFMDLTEPESVLMVWHQVGSFEIRGHKTIIVEPAAGVEERFLAFPILGPVLAWVLNGKGLFLLHASAIDIEGRTAVFMGDKLAGKSTTAAAFVRAGHSLVTDDLVAISFSDPLTPKIMPAFAQIKLAEDAAAAVSIQGAVAQPLIHKDFPKRQHSLPDMTTSPISADWFFKLVRGGDDVALTRMTLPNAIGTLNRFSYMSRFANANWSDAEDARHFRSCAQLANLTKVGELGVPAGLDRLPETVSFVTEVMRRKLP